MHWPPSSYETDLSDETDERSVDGVEALPMILPPNCYDTDPSDATDERSPARSVHNSHSLPLPLYPSDVHSVGTHVSATYLKNRRTGLGESSDARSAGTHQTSTSLNNLRMAICESSGTYSVSLADLIEEENVSIDGNDDNSEQIMASAQEKESSSGFITSPTNEIEPEREGLQTAPYVEANPNDETGEQSIRDFGVPQPTSCLSDANSAGTGKAITSFNNLQIGLCLSSSIRPISLADWIENNHVCS